MYLQNLIRFDKKLKPPFVPDPDNAEWKLSADKDLLVSPLKLVPIFVRSVNLSVRVGIIARAPL